jgi:hypothetical protein
MTVASWLLLRRDHVVRREGGGFFKVTREGGGFSKLRGTRSATTVARMSERCSQKLTHCTQHRRTLCRLQGHTPCLPRSKATLRWDCKSNKNDGNLGCHISSMRIDLFLRAQLIHPRHCTAARRCSQPPSRRRARGIHVRDPRFFENFRKKKIFLKNITM